MLDEAATARSTTAHGWRWFLASLARDLYHSWEHDHLARATAMAEQAVDLARRHGDPMVLAHCLLALNDTRWLPGSAHERPALIEEGLDLAMHTRDQQLHT